MTHSTEPQAAPDCPQHSLLTSLGLHVLPGMLTIIAFLIFKPLFDTSGYPPLLAFLLAVFVADVAPKTVTIELEDGVLHEGKNTVIFVFAETFGGTTGFSILDVRILLREQFRQERSYK